MMGAAAGPSIPLSPLQRNTRYAITRNISDSMWQAFKLIDKVWLLYVIATTKETVRCPCLGFRRWGLDCACLFPFQIWPSYVGGSVQRRASIQLPPPSCATLAMLVRSHSHWSTPIACILLRCVRRDPKSWFSRRDKTVAWSLVGSSKFFDSSLLYRFQFKLSIIRVSQQPPTDRPVAAVWFLIDRPAEVSGLRPSAFASGRPALQMIT